MSAADLAAIREALEMIVTLDKGLFCAGCGHADGPINCPTNCPARLALAALDRIEQNTLTPEEARRILDDQAAADFHLGTGELCADWIALLAKLERIAGDTTEATTRCHCGSLDWTVTQHGRVTHKHACPARTDDWCQTHPKGCPTEATT